MILAGYQVSLRQVESTDLEQLRTWRNDPDIAKFMLSQGHISKQQQLHWFEKIQADNSQQHFVIDYKGIPIGVANIRSSSHGQSLLQTKVIEPGIYIADKKYRANILAFAPTLLINDYCFESLKAEKLLAKVKAENIAALNYNIKLGYQITSHSDLIEISLIFNDYQRHSKVLKALLSRPSRRKLE